MTTALQIMTRSMRLAGVIGKGESLDADESADGLAALNSMLESWQTDRLFVYQIREDKFTLLTGFFGYTVGTGGDFNIPRPVKLEDTCFILKDNVQYPVG